jgi:hypothetical protein
MHKKGIFSHVTLFPCQTGCYEACIFVETSLSTPECGEIAVMVMLEKWPFFLFAREKSFAGGEL